MHFTKKQSTNEYEKNKPDTVIVLQIICCRLEHNINYNGCTLHNVHTHTHGDTETQNNAASLCWTIEKYELRKFLMLRCLEIEIKVESIVREKKKNQFEKAHVILLHRCYFSFIATQSSKDPHSQLTGHLCVIFTCRWSVVHKFWLRKKKNTHIISYTKTKVHRQNKAGLRHNSLCLSYNISASWVSKDTNWYRLDGIDQRSSTMFSRRTSTHCQFGWLLVCLSLS